MEEKQKQEPATTKHTVRPIGDEKLDPMQAAHLLIDYLGDIQEDGLALIDAVCDRAWTAQTVHAKLNADVRAVHVLFGKLAEAGFFSLIKQ